MKEKDMKVSVECCQCQTASQAKPFISKNISFGKYLELLMYSSGFNLELCGHSDYQQLFSFEGFQIKVNIIQNQIFDVIIPCKKFDGFSNQDCDAFYPLRQCLHEDISKFYKSLFKYLDEIRMW